MWWVIGPVMEYYIIVFESDNEIHTVQHSRRCYAPLKLVCDRPETTEEEEEEEEEDDEDKPEEENSTLMQWLNVFGFRWIDRVLRSFVFCVCSLDLSEFSGLWRRENLQARSTLM